jgi:hypothetical protein
MGSAMRSSLTAQRRAGILCISVNSLLGQTVSHYSISRRLDSGGIGVVYEAEDSQLGWHVVPKFLPAASRATWACGLRAFCCGPSAPAGWQSPVGTDLAAAGRPNLFEEHELL